MVLAVMLATDDRGNDDEYAHTDTSDSDVDGSNDEEGAGQNTGG